MHSAAYLGQLPIVKILVEDFGVGVDETDGSSEGPITVASGEGHANIVKYLLGKGATINRIDPDGCSTCYSLMRAARHGHLDIVKLLIKHGADLDAAPLGINALMEAEFSGQDEVAAYLRSIGAKDLREVTPPDYVQARQKVVYIGEDLWGASEHLVTLSGKPSVVVYVTTGKVGEEVDTIHGPSLFTVGLSDRFIPEASEPFNCLELEMHLAPSWPLSELTKDDSEWNWPLVWIKKIAEALQSAESFEYPAYFMNGDPPEALTHNSSLCGWVGLRSSRTYRQFTDHRWFSFLHLHPIRPEEQGMIGFPEHDSLVIRLEEGLGLPSWIVPDREPIQLTPDRK